MLERKDIFFYTLFFVSSFSGRSLAQVGPGTECVCYQVLGDGLLYNPVDIGHMRDSSGRILVAEQRGYIWIFNEDGSKDPTPYLDMTGPPLFLSPGLVNFALHPDYLTNGHIYLFHTVVIDGDYYQRVSEMTRSGTDPDVLDPATERVVMDIDYPYVSYLSQQTGGALLFGIDGYLYIGLGDGHCCHDPYDNAQNRSTALGSVLRIDVDSRTGNLEYGIPPDNPFLDDPDAIPELFAYGFRQDYTAAMDQGDQITGEGRGRIFVGDVGEDSYEEINELFSGGNYGWPNWEGPLCHRPEECSTMGPVIEPAIYYNRTMGICVILAGVYRGCLNPDLNGWMLYLDYGNPVLFGATEQPDSTWAVQTIPVCESCPAGLNNTRHPQTIGTGVDGHGEIWFGASDNQLPNTIGASVYKIVDPNNPGTCQTAE